jgi:3-oxoacyl-[acyl-carrier protein] reductase
LKLLADRTSVVTGAGNGIGRATAIRFAAEGARVALIDIEEKAIEEVVDEITSTGNVAIAIVGDIRDEASIAAAIGHAEAELGAFDILVANAGIEPADDARADELDLKVWRRVIDTNLTGCFLTCKHGLRVLLRNQASDRVILITVSPTGVRGMAPGQDAYSASKAGVLGLMRVLAADYAPHGIRVNGVLPGFTDTRANAAIFDNPSLLEDVLRLVPMNRAGTPEEVASTMSWVASAHAQYVTGAVFAVDGGMTAV